MARINSWGPFLIFNLKTGYQLVTSTDTFSEGVHFFKNTSASDIAYKSLAVNLSDIAAMGATAKYFTLALTLPKLDQVWLKNQSILPPLEPNIGRRSAENRSSGSSHILAQAILPQATLAQVWDAQDSCGDLPLPSRHRICTQ